MLHHNVSRRKLFDVFAWKYVKLYLERKGRIPYEFCRKYRRNQLMNLRTGSAAEIHCRWCCCTAQCNNALSPAKLKTMMPRPSLKQCAAARIKAMLMPPLRPNLKQCTVVRLEAVPPWDNRLMIWTIWRPRGRISESCRYIIKAQEIAARGKLQRGSLKTTAI